MKKKAVAIVIVWGVLIVLSMLAMSALRLMSNQGFMTESSVRRTKAYYTAKAAMVQALEDLRKGRDPDITPVNINGMTADITYEAPTDVPPPTTPCTGDCGKLTIVVDY